MSIKADDTMTKKIYREYSAFLDKAGIRYHNNQNGFYVYIDLKNIKDSFTHVCRAFDGKVLLTDYCGTCYTGIRKVKRVMKAIQEKFPNHDIHVELYGGSFEIDIYYEIDYSTIEALHEAVLSVAEVVDEGVKIAREMLEEEEFER